MKKKKIAHITACQPGLVNGFAYKLVEDNPDKESIDHDDYLKVEDWYLTEAIDKNIANSFRRSYAQPTFVLEHISALRKEKLKWKHDLLAKPARHSPS